MDSESEELYLMKLKQFIYDEDKIVTAVWFSKECNIPIQSSQALLKQFIEDEKSPKAGGKTLGISYTLIGTTKDSEKLCIMIVKHDQLEEKKKLFKAITSELVNSVQKAVDVNFNTIGLLDMLNLHGNNGTLSGCPVSKNCVIRSNLPNRKVLPAVQRAAGTDKSKASHLFANKAKDTNKAPSTSIAVKKEEDIKKEAAEEKIAKPEVKTESKGKLTKQNSGDKKNGNAIANMFAKAPPPKEKPKKGPAEAMDIDDDDNHAIDTKTRVNGEDKSPKTNGKASSNNKQDLYDSGTDEEAQKVEAANKAKVKDEGKVAPKKKAPRNKRPRDDRSVERPEKKRKRIVQVVESDEDIFADSDDNEHNNDSNVIMSEEDEPQSKIQTKALAAKNKKRKFVDKTYTDDEGYIVTKREYVQESGESEEEDKENPPKAEVQQKVAPKETKQISPPNKKKKQPAKPANQPTLMNFFKKK